LKNMHEVGVSRSGGVRGSTGKTKRGFCSKKEDCPHSICEEKEEEKKKKEGKKKKKGKGGRRKKERKKKKKKEKKERK